jgi:xanthine permease XanP
LCWVDLLFYLQKEPNLFAHSIERSPLSMVERPKDLIYALDERPPLFQLLALGFQHTSVICPYLVMIALVAGAAKLPHDSARNSMALAMIAVAFLTVLQSLGLGWVGSGYLCPPVVSAILPPWAVVFSLGGFTALGWATTAR